MIVIVAFGWIVTGGTGRFIAEESFGNFYDHQAASLLKGRLDVPALAISFEAFVRDGKSYGYFGPTPALLRIPFVVCNVAFGRLSRVFMLGYFAAALIAAYLLWLDARTLIGGLRMPPPAADVVLFVINIGLGSTLFFLSSRAYIYHEAILCGAVFALWSAWCALRHLAAPSRRWWIGALVCGLLSVHARPPTGLFSLTVLGAVAGVEVFRAWRTPAATVASRCRPILIGALTVLALLSFNGLSYLKFHRFEGLPLQLHVQYNAARLAQTDGRLFHLGNIPFNADAYLIRPNCTLTPYFPYLRMSVAPQTRFPAAKMDLVEPMLGLPFAMPGLLFLATAGGVMAFITNYRARSVILVVWLSAVPMTLSMLATVAVSQRYTADFCPFLICSACFGIAAGELLRGAWRHALRGITATLTVTGALITLALTLHFQGEGTWGVSDSVRRDYAAGRARIDRFFGVANPEGYSIDHLPIRLNDASTDLFMAHLLAQDPATRLKAIELYERSLQIAPNVTAAHLGLGDMMFELGRLPECVAQYQAVLQLDPNHARALNNLGAAYARQGQITAALPYFQRAVQLDPSNQSARMNLEKLRAMIAAPK